MTFPDRRERLRSLWLRTLLIASVALCALHAHAQTPTTILLPDELRALNADIETVDGPFPGALIIPRRTGINFDERYTQPFHAICYAYAGERDAGGPNDAPARYLHRFTIHVPGEEALPLARRAGRLLLLLYGEDRLRLRHDHPAQQAVDVWLTSGATAGQGADAGGEQFRNQIYIYDLYAQRNPIEWARELAHEYGHYALPGVTGFSAPEEWANGYLGERLFLKWLRDDLLTGRLQPDAIPFVTPAEIDTYVERQVTPLIQRYSQGSAGFDPSQLLTRRDAAGMDNYIGLALYLDAVYGSVALFNALSYTEPRAGGELIFAPDFLRGALTSLRAATGLSITPPLPQKGQSSESFLIYMPPGTWTVSAGGALRSWRFDGSPAGAHPAGADRLIVRAAAWRRLTLTWQQSTSSPARLLLHRD